MYPNKRIFLDYSSRSPPFIFPSYRMIFLLATFYYMKLSRPIICYNMCIKERFKLYTLFILLSLLFVEILTRVFNSFLDFDEGYNLQVSQNLHNHFLYETHLQLFDPRITTGPPILIPAAFLINTLQPLLPRLVMLLYAALGLFLVLKY